ncbi:hypothetical protein D3C72_1446650 [compost metagenome]
MLPAGVCAITVPASFALERAARLSETAASAPPERTPARRLPSAFRRTASSMVLPVSSGVTTAPMRSAAMRMMTAPLRCSWPQLETASGMPIMAESFSPPLKPVVLTTPSLPASMRSNSSLIAAFCGSVTLVRKFFPLVTVYIMRPLLSMT